MGRDVESMIRDLTELSINMVKKEEHEQVAEKAKEMAEENILDLLLPAEEGDPRTESRRGPRTCRGLR